ncbi:MAG: FliO/MopB family protein [Sedimentisphaerales bacterium]|nr:FliO/MopB family protein [Sedimentisphaerales bacterium]
MKKSRWIWIATGLFLFLAVAPAWPKIESNKTPIKDPNTLSSKPGSTPLDKMLQDRSSLPTSELLRKFAIAIGFVAVLAIAAFFVSKRVMPRIATPKGKEISVVETIPLGVRRSLHLVKIGPNRRILIGSTNDSISYLADVSETFSIEENKED